MCIRDSGREIYKFAARQVPVVVKEILEKAGKSVEEVDLTQKELEER